MKFEMAMSEAPEEISIAVQKALINAIRDVVSGLKSDLKQPGLTWEQLEWVLDGFQNKAVTILRQKDSM